MGSKHLKELLNEDQEPFVLQNYINEKRCQMKSSLQIKKRKPISQNSSFPFKLCKNACFLSSTPKSPLFDLYSPAKSPIRTNHHNTLFVHIPAKTAALLVEAALRIQNHSASQKSRKSALGFGVFGSILKRIGSKTKKKGGEMKDIIRWDSGRKKMETNNVVGLEEKGICQMGLSCSCNSRRTSVWSESNEEKSLDLESSSSRSEDSEEMEYLVGESKISDFGGFCSSPFRFVLLNSDLKTPLASPTRLKPQVVAAGEEDTLNAAGKEHDDDKDQNSPVSVLDPPFEDDDDDEGHEDEVEEEQNEFELHRGGFANVQRAKHQLLHKLRRFERLADLDPIELEKRMAEQEDEDRSDAEEYTEDEDLYLSESEEIDDAFVRHVLQHSDLYHHQQTSSSDTKKLIMDLVVEEMERQTESYNSDLIAKKVSERLGSWKEVDSNTIDMMVELDFKKDTEEWKKNPEQMNETAAAVELAIFSFLVEELSDELVRSSGC